MRSVFRAEQAAGHTPDLGSGRQRRALCTVYLRTRLVLLHRSIFTGGHGVWPSRWGFFLIQPHAYVLC